MRGIYMVWLWREEGVYLWLCVWHVGRPMDTRLALYRIQRRGEEDTRGRKRRRKGAAIATSPLRPPLQFYSRFSLPPVMVLV